MTLGGNLDADAGVDVTGLLQADDNVILGSDNTDLLTVNAGADFNDVVNIDGNLDANAGVDVTGLLQADDNVILGSDNTDLLTVNAGADFNDIVNIDGNLDANSGLDVTGADLTVGGGNFTVDDATGDVSTAGSIDITENLSFDLTNPVNEIVTDLEVDLAAPSDNALVTESALASSIGNQAGSGLTYNTTTNEIDLGGDLTEDADIGVETGYTFIVSDADENAA